MDTAEWPARVDLAACYRLHAHYGWTELIYTHISARVPGPHEHFLINPFGLMFDEVTASSLVKIDLDGNILSRPGTPFIGPASSSIALCMRPAPTRAVSSMPIPARVWRCPR
jgi:ribulose-5-phosphate 4-epimerase/fuculose-1-phosphate aldolase